MKNGVDEKIINRIKKLLKLTESPVLAEAEEAARKVHELLIKYNLDIQEVQQESSEYVEEDAVKSKRFFTWQIGLHVAVARLNLCSTMSSHMRGGMKVLKFFGRPCNTLTAKHTYEYLLEVIKRITEARTIGLSRKEKNSFRLGLVMGLSDVVDEILQKDMESSDCKSLVISEEHNLKKAMKDLGCGQAKQRTVYVDAAFNEGYEKGREIPLNKQVNSSQPQTQMSLCF